MQQKYFISSKNSNKRFIDTFHIGYKHRTDATDSWETHFQFLDIIWEIW